MTDQTRRRDLPLTVLHLGRRTGLPAAAVVASGSLTPSGQRAGPGRPVDDIRQVASSLRRLDGQIGPAHVAPAVRRHLQAVIDLGEQVAQEDRRELIQLASETAELAGWLAYDAGIPDEAELHYRRAMTLAQEADDPARAAWAMGNLGRALTSMGRAREALDHLEAARRLAAGVQAPRLASWLAAAAGWCYATLGEHAACGQALSAAERHLAQPDDSGYEWLDFYSYSQLDKWYGRCQLLFGRPAEAARSFRTSLRMLPATLVRERASTLTELAHAYTKQGNVDAACACLSEAVTIALDTGSGRIVQRVTEVRRLLDS